MTGTSARYRILRRLGHGGMAEVFEAELVGELGFLRKVAIKRMLGDAAADPRSARRFLDEATIASQLHHANIVAVLDLGLLDHLPFQVLELVEGINAHQLVQRAGGRLPIEIALIIAGQIAHALDHAHGAQDATGVPLGIVHRDVKPSNVLVSWGGDVKLSDFGIAVARDRSAQTEAGFVTGTMGFIAPEQRTRSELDGRTDVFALGLTLHALLTGHTPLEDVAVETAMLTGVPVPLDPTLPVDLLRLIGHAVAPARTDRPTAMQFADALGAALAGRLDRDARTHLRSFLGELERRPDKKGALDALLGIEVVLTDEPRADGVRHYATVAAARPGGDPVEGRATDQPTVVGGGPLPEPSQGGDVPTDAYVPRRRFAPLAIAAVMVASAGAVSVWRMRSDEPAPSRASVVDAAAIPTRATDGGADPDATVSQDAGDVRDAASGLTLLDAAIDARPRHLPRVDARIDVATPGETGDGYVQVVGEDLVGAQLIVDGKPAGFAPSLIKVPLGHHRLEVRPREAGRPPMRREIDVTSFHSRSQPLYPEL